MKISAVASSVLWLLESRYSITSCKQSQVTHVYVYVTLRERGSSAAFPYYFTATISPRGIPSFPLPKNRVYLGVRTCKEKISHVIFFLCVVACARVWLLF